MVKKFKKNKGKIHLYCDLQIELIKKKQLFYYRQNLAFLIQNL